MAQQWPLLTNHNERTKGVCLAGIEAHVLMIPRICRSILQLGLTMDQCVQGDVVERGVDVVGGIEDEKVLLLLDELDGRG